MEGNESGGNESGGNESGGNESGGTSREEMSREEGLARKAIAGSPARPESNRRFPTAHSNRPVRLSAVGGTGTGLCAPGPTIWRIPGLVRASALPGGLSGPNVPG